MAAECAPALLEPTLSTTLWGIVVHEHLEELATLAWYRVADGKFLKDIFSRKLARLGTISFEARISEPTYSQARDVLTAQAIAIVSTIRIEESGDWSIETNSVGTLPYLARLSLVLKVIIRSPEPDTVKYLGVFPDEVQVLTGYAIDRLKISSPAASMRAPHQQWVSYAFETRHELSTAAGSTFTLYWTGATPASHLRPQLEEGTAMARIMEIHTPADFRPKTRYVPQEERGRPIIFPGNLKRSCVR